jgi:hypothetical protein
MLSQRESARAARGIAALIIGLATAGQAAAQGTGVAIAPLVWGGAVEDGRTGVAAAAGVHVEYSAATLTTALRWERFTGALRSCKGPVPLFSPEGPPTACGDAGAAWSVLLLRRIRTSEHLAIALGPQLSLVDWHDAGTAFGAGVTGRFEVPIGAGSFALEPFVRSVWAAERIYYGGAALVLLMRLGDG